ncbi:MAG TPA: cyclic nucleotide-binding protein, partial [Spirochaetota bacterium]|nr:cyclic nucleotide-binding protein [Spirochaetota bacterium]
KIATLQSGEIIGEMSFVDSNPPYAMVKSAIESTVYIIDKKKLVDKIESDNGFGYRFYKAISIFLADRLRDSISFLGYGKRENDDEISDPDKLDSILSDTISVAGERFSRMLSKMMTK